METTRQNKIERLLQKELGEVFLLQAKPLFGGAMITVTRVNISKDLSVCKVYLSVFATADKTKTFNLVKSKSFEIKRMLVVHIKSQLRSIPSLEYFLDDSLDYIERIETLLKH